MQFLNNPDVWLYIVVIVSIMAYAVRSMFNSWQDRLTEEAKARVKVAELELQKQRESPKFAPYVPPSHHLYEEGLAPLQEVSE